MKKIYLRFKLFTSILLIFLALTSCVNHKPKDYKSEDGLLSINKPNSSNDLLGKWKLKTSHELENQIKNSEANNEQDNSPTKNNEIFITNSVFEYKNIKILNPNITARYINIEDYMNSKSLEKPLDINLGKENVIVYKIQDDKILSQDIIQLANGNLIIFQKNRVEAYEKYKSIAKDEEREHFSRLKNSIEGTDKAPNNLEYAITIGIRKNNYAKSGETLDYDYSTYFIVKEKDYQSPRFLLVKDIVFSKDSVLWTVAHERSYSQDKLPLISDKISINPTFRSEASKINNIEETVARRIDYVNDNYIAFTNKNQLAKDKYEYYEIHNISQLAKNKPLTVNNIGGPKALESFNSAFTDTIYSIANQSNIILDFKADASNIGMVRNRMGWGFISNFQAELPDTGRTIYRSIPLRIIPILDLGAFDNKNISWRDVLNRVPFATNAIVSPDGKTIIIQAKNQISIYSIYNNFISLNPQITITNVYGNEIIMSKWYPKDMIRPIYEDYLKLPRVSNREKN